MKVWQMAAVTILLGGLSVAPVSLPAFCGCSTTCGVTSAHAAENQTVDLALEGLTCAACKFAVKAALSESMSVMKNVRPGSFMILRK